MRALKTQISEIYRRVKRFLGREVWSKDISKLPWYLGFFYRVVRFIEHTISGFIRDRCLLRASALTYASLLSLVPLLALMFALLKGLGFQRRVEPILLDRFTGGSQEVVSQILQYIDRTNVSSLGAVGVLSLVLTVVLVLKNMEKSFNWIWKVRKGRSLMRTVSEYLSVLMIAPISILLALSLTTYFNSQVFIERMESIWLLGDFYRFMIKMTPFVVLWIAFTACYIFMPNTRVRVDAALLGGVVGGTLWQFAQWGYVRYQIGVAKYNAIYGALSQLPILLVWIYVSWVILLFGAEIAFAYQYLRQYTESKILSFQKERSHAYRVLLVLRAVMKRFESGEEPYTLNVLSESLHVPRSFIQPSLERLEALGWIASLKGEESPIVFKRPPDKMPLHQVLSLNRDIEAHPRKAFLVVLLERADQGIKKALKDLTVGDLIGAEAVDQDLGTQPQSANP
jgi:membrane protein